MPVENPFSAWVRANPALDSVRDGINVCDTDLWVHLYKTGADRRGDRSVQYIMLLELKSHGADMSSPQRDLLGMLDRILRSHPRKRDRDAGGRFEAGHSETPLVHRVYSHFNHAWVQLKWMGVHALFMDGTTPNNSASLKWDKTVISTSQLEKLLRFELHPDDPRKPLDLRRRKKRRKFQSGLPFGKDECN